jgi:hypothetical protein
MADLIAQGITTTTVAVGGTTRLQIFGGNVGNQWLICDFELTSAQGNSLSAALPISPAFYILAAAANNAMSNSALTMNNSAQQTTASIPAGSYITVATAGGTLPPTVLLVNSVTNNTSIRVTYVSGANANNTASGDVAFVTFPATAATTTITQAAQSSPLPGVTNAI